MNPLVFDGAQFSSSGSILNFYDKNFVQTCETDRYYDASGTYQAEIQQCYSPDRSLYAIGFLILLFFIVAFFIIKLFK